MKYLRLLITLSLLTAAFQMKAQETPAQPDFGDQSSQVLTTKAWDALQQKNYQLALAYTDRCIELYSTQAAEMQAKLTEPAPSEHASKLWALNDVGTCLYIQGQANEALGKSSEALADYQKLVKDYSFAQTWDPKGWFWRPSEAAKQRIKVIEFDAL